jgi:hypothetical protein
MPTDEQIMKKPMERMQGIYKPKGRVGEYAELAPKLYER